MSSQVLQRVSELIKEEPSLERIKEIKEQLAKEKSTVEYQLDKESAKHFKDAVSSFELMNLSQKSVRSLREKIAKVDTLSKENKSSIDRYEIINNATKMHELMEKTTNVYDKIANFNELFDNIDTLLDTELSRDTLESGCPSLLKIHYMLNMARDFQDQMSVLAKISTDDVQRTMGKVFSRLPEIIGKFDKLIDSIVYDLIEAVRTENQSLLIRLFKIIELEEREDLKIIAIRNIIKTKEKEADASKIKKLPNNLTKLSLDETAIEYPTYGALAKEIMSGTIQTRTQPRGYKNFLFKTIQKSIQDMFVEVRKEYQGDKQFELLNNLDWVLNELIIAKEHLPKYCPDRWRIFHIYYEYYYTELNKLITELVNAEPETLVILDILDYDKSFQASMKKDFGFSKDQLQSVIGEKEKETLLSDYLHLIVDKMKEWFSNLEKTEINIFVERTTPPHTDSENLLFLDGTKTCFQMFSQQVEVAAGSGQAKILVGVVEKFCGLLSQRQKRWMDIIGDEVKKSINYSHKCEENPEDITKEEESSGGLVEYLVAVANDQMKAADYAVAISQKYGAMVSKVHERTITMYIESTLDGFAEVAKCSTMGLITLMFDDLRSPYKEVFSKSWYSGNQAQQIADTLFEYLGDIREQMNPFVFSTLVESVVEESILRFIECLKYEHSFKAKHNKFLECMKRDFEVFYKLFIQFVPEEEKSIVDDKFKLMEFFMDFSCNPINSMIETWQQCLEVYWDCPVILLSAILRCRKDVDSSTTKQIVASAQQLSQDPHRVAQLKTMDLQPTFISRFHI